LLAALCAVVSAVSLLLVFVNRRAFPPLPESPGPSSEDLPSVTVVIPARNEEHSVSGAIRSHLDGGYPRLEVLVVDDRSTDRTPEVLAGLAAADERVRVIAGVEPPAGWLGKPHALWQGAEAARGAWLLFADADVVYAPGALLRAVAHARAKDLALLCLLGRLETRGFWEGVLMPNLYASVYMGPGFLLVADGNLRGGAGAGSGNLVRRDAYDAAGGHETLRDAVVDDLALAREVKRTGGRTRACAAFDCVTVRMYRGFREIFRGFSKNVAWAFRNPWVVLALVAVFAAISLFPWVAVLAPGSGPAVRALSAAAILLTVAGRVLVARTTRSPVWSAFFHPIMVAVWSAIAVVSFWRRAVLRRIVWRGRTTSVRSEE